MQDHAKAVFQRHDRLQFEVCGLPTLSASLLSAVPQNSASAAAWKLCSDSASEHLAKYCNEQARKAEHSSLDAAVILSAQLKDTDLCFIPKPNKPPTKPSNLRPLGIIRPDGKGLAGACRDLLAPYTSSYLKSVPQFAYQPQRGLSDALSRVSKHTREVQVRGTAYLSARRIRWELICILALCQLWTQRSKRSAGNEPCICCQNAVMPLIPECLVVPQLPEEYP